MNLTDEELSECEMAVRRKLERARVAKKCDWASIGVLTVALKALKDEAYRRITVGLDGYREI